MPPLPVNGGDVPHVKAGAADPLQKCLSQFRGDIIHCVQLLGGVVVADKQPNLVDKDGKMGEIGEEGQVIQGGSILVARAGPISYDYATSSQMILLLLSYYYFVMFDVYTHCIWHFVTQGCLYEYLPFVEHSPHSPSPLVFLTSPHPVSPVRSPKHFTATSMSYTHTQFYVSA